MNPLRLHLVLALCGLFASSCSDDPPATTDGGVLADATADTNVPMDGGEELDAAVSCDPLAIPDLAFESILSAGSFDAPIFVTQAPGVNDALWVVERAGVIRLVRGGSSSVFLDITSRIGSEPGGNDERGLLGLAFAPDYATSGRFFVNFTNTTGARRNRVAEYHRSDSDADAADPTEVALLVDQVDPESNHNGGMIAFGPDGMLYVGMGDGGGAGDEDHGPIGSGLDLQTLLGKLLRLDIDAAGTEYAAAGNPFAAPDGLPQIWAYGLRNPWRFSFDTANGDLYIGDVGQNDYEEIDYVSHTSTGGENYGWRAYEGNHVFNADNVDLVPVHTAPIVEVEHSLSSEVLRNSCSIAGGYVYHGSAIPALDGVYFFGDFCSTDVAALRRCGTAMEGPERVTSLSGECEGAVSFGQDNAGELYIVCLDENQVKKLVPAS